MKICPLRKMKTYNYPSYADVQNGASVDRSGSISRRGLLPWMTWMGLISLWAAQQTKGAESATLPAMNQSVSPVPKKIEPGKVARWAAAVAPFLEDAMRNDGRGTFGCVAVTAGWYMPEDEALELIRMELEAAGLNLQEGLPLDDIQIPVCTYQRGRSTKTQMQNRTIRFDWADPERGVYIDFLGKGDWRAWTSHEIIPLAESVDFPDLASRVAAAYEEYKAPTPTRFGIFFDPIADDGVASPSYVGLPPDIEAQAEVEYKKRREKIKWEKAKYRLHLQVQHFIDYLRKEGVIDAEK